MHESIIDSLILPTRFKERITLSVNNILSLNIENLYRIILFGSCSKSRVNKYSDVDLALIIEGLPNPEQYADIRNRMWDLEEDEEIETDLYMSTKSNYEDTTSIANNMLRGGIILYESIRK